MPYYHVKVHWKDEFGDSRRNENVDFRKEQISHLVQTIKQGGSFIIKNFRVSPFGITKFEIWRTEESARGKPNRWDWISAHGINVTNNFIISLPTKSRLEERHSSLVTEKAGSVPSTNVFVVHGRDLEPVKELKIMLSKFGLYPIVLHEKPGGSRTIIEKLEKHSDVGYTFVILTPDDVGYCQDDVESVFDDATKEKHPRLKHVIDFLKEGYDIGHGDWILEVLQDFLPHLRERARQNVVLEFGYFMGKLTRDRVCCLLKGDVERPSDMNGIVYVPFKKSVNEVRTKIIKELEAAGYQISVP